MSQQAYLIARFSKKALSDMTDDELHRGIHFNNRVANAYDAPYWNQWRKAIDAHPHWAAYKPEKLKEVGFPDRRQMDRGQPYRAQAHEYAGEAWRRHDARRDAAEAAARTTPRPRSAVQAVADAKPSRGPGRKIALGVGLAGVGAGTGAVVVRRRRRNRE